MGREIRRVIPNWDHPKNDHYAYQPMHDKSCEEAWKLWNKEYQKALVGEYDNDFIESDLPIDQPYLAYCEYDGLPPDPLYYRPQWIEEPAWWQAYETVSEGTPVTPPFSTQQELIDYLVENGDFWDQKRKRRREGVKPWTREQAEKFVLGGWAPTFVLDSKGIRSGVEASGDINQ